MIMTAESNEIISALVPRLNPLVRIYSFDARHILVECNNHQLKIKKELQLLFQLVNGSNNIGNITGLYCSATNQNISEEFIHRLLFNDLAVYGIIVSDVPVKIKERSLHLRLSFIFWKGKWLNHISRIISPLFNPVFFYTSLILMILFITPVIIFFNYHGLNKAIEFKNIFLYAVLSFTVVMFHELGHVSACYKYGAKHKGIGFGFYLFTPTFFADVSDAWRLPRKERIIINLGGIYIELVIVTVLFCCFLAGKSEILFYSGIAILLQVLVNLNPFLKYDGYWVLSDITGTPNLRAQSTQRLKSIFSIDQLGRFSREDFGLLLYAIMSYITIALFLFFLFFYNSSPIIRFPATVFKAVLDFNVPKAAGIARVFQELIKNIIPLIFYITLTRFLYSGIKNRFFTHSAPGSWKKAI
jgi:putative peptide zinc metalloprotease protein